MIVIDTNTFSSVFNEEASDHDEFMPVVQWVKNARGACFVYGGTKYRNELKKVRSMLEFLVRYRKINKVVEIDGELIDAYEAKLESMNQSAAFNKT